MPITLGTNISSLRAQRQLGVVGRRLDTVYERLSSGQRINRASDDAAGLAVSEKLKVNVAIANRAILNISDGVSLISIASGALEQITTLLDRMSELSNQAANGVLGRLQKRTLDDEFAALSAEIDRIAKSTTFNRSALFKGEKSTALLEAVGSNGGGITATITSSNGQFTVAQGTNSSIYNSQTGETVSMFSGNITAGSVRVADNGDVFFRTPSGMMGDGQLKKFDYATQTVSNVTNEFADTALGNFDISADGSTLAFFSTTQYTDGGTVASGTSIGQRQLYIMDVATGIVRTNGEEVPAGFVKLSEDGSKVAIWGAYGQLEAPFTSNSALHVANYSSSGLSASTAIAGIESSSPNFLTMRGINNKGEIIFNSTLDFTGENSGGIDQFFKIDSSGSVSQLTKFSTTFAKSAFSLDSRLTALNFVSNQNLLGENDALVNQIFRLDIQSGKLFQMTDYQTPRLTSVASASLSKDGRVFSTRAASDIMQANVEPTRSSIRFEVGTGSRGTISAEMESILTTLSGQGTLVISSSQSALFALDVIGKNREAVSDFQGRLGASLSRLATASNLLGSQSTELNAALSRIRDADMAAETAELAKISILQQSVAAVLGQANQQPALALELLSIPLSR